MAIEHVEEYVRLWQRLDEIEGDTEEREAICDECDGPWYAMSAAEQDEVRRRIRVLMEEKKKHRSDLQGG